MPMKKARRRNQEYMENVWCDGILPKELHNAPASSVIRNRDLESMAAMW